MFTFLIIMFITLVWIEFASCPKGEIVDWICRFVGITTDVVIIVFKTTQPTTEEAPPTSRGLVSSENYPAWVSNPSHVTFIDHSSQFIRIVYTVIKMTNFIRFKKMQPF